MTAPVTPACAICGGTPAHRGYRLPGVLSSLPQGKRGTLRCCDRPECVAAAEQRWNRAKGVIEE